MNQHSQQLLSWQFWLLILLASLSLVLVIVNIVLSTVNQSVQTEINSRQQYINEGVKVSQLNSQMIQTLANLSAKTGDKEIRDLLSRQGITFDIKIPEAKKPEDKAESLDQQVKATAKKKKLVKRKKKKYK